jgi:hypothetical protein
MYSQYNNANKKVKGETSFWGLIPVGGKECGKGEGGQI